MRKRLLIIISICTGILAVISGVWFYQGVFTSGDETEKTGRFDFYLYTIAPDNTLIPFSLAVDNQPIPDQAPRIYFESLKNAWLYLLLFSPENEMTVLFPAPGGNFPHDYEFAQYFLPKNYNWEPYLQSPGQYTLYFVFSTSPLKTVERLLSRYEEYRKARKPESVQRETIARLKAEVEKHRREQGWIKNTGAVPEWIDGTVRGNEDDVIYRAWSIPFRGIITHSVVFQYFHKEDDE
ncbi:MAG: hypothetical protein JXB88_24370 [Spirochaetales bacterium]|nr:hypothetical protein [Spirochaetales bacterium]